MNKTLSRSFLAIGCIVSLAASTTSAAIIVDGTLDADYGPAKVIQTVQTQFGDSNGGVGGSELDAVFTRVEDGRLFLFFAGNLEPNFNKFDVFIDSVRGGENTLSGVPDYDFNNGSSWISSNLNGLTFDDGFTADYHMIARWGSPTSGLEVDFVNRQGGTIASVPGSNGVGANGVGNVSVGSISAGAVGPNASAAALTQSLNFAINNNNDGGVVGGCDAADQIAALSVTTGMEFSIDLADIGSPQLGDRVLVSAMINNGDHNYLSNQILGGLSPSQCNLGGDGAGGFVGDLSGVDFGEFGRVQDFKVQIAVPEPTGLCLLLVGLLAFIRR